MPKLETVRVKREGPRGSHIINAADYDPKVHELAKGETPPAATSKGGDDGPAKTPAEVLAMFEDKDVTFFGAKAEAKKILGDDTPSKKDDIIAALGERVTAANGE